MQSIAPPGQRDLDFDTRERLHALTELLIEADDTACDEYGDFLAVQERRLDLSLLEAQLATCYQGKRILVTGGTGCIGSTLIRELTRCFGADIYCLYSRDNSFDPVPGVVYIDVDICDEELTVSAIREVNPQVIFHCAAQRSPMLAEREVGRTVMTNVIGTRNVLRGAREVEPERFIHTSTGKAMRYYTTDIYAASKKICEWLVQVYAAEGRPAGLARFTHVVDNAVVLETVQAQMDDPNGLVRCHGADIAFYVQSAIESAQLLMVAGVVAEPRLKAVAIRSLGEPARLLSMLLGKLQSGLTSDHPPIYLSGYDKGYEKGNPPGLYNPMTAADLSPLINAIEALSATELEEVPEIDQFHLALPTGDYIERIVDGLEWVCRNDEPLKIAAELAGAVKEEAEAMFSLCPEPLFTQLNKMATQGGVALPCSRSSN